MIVMQTPQFSTQDDSGHGDGIAPIREWFEASNYDETIDLPLFNTLDPAVYDVLARLRVLFHQPERFHLATTDLHDLTCFTMHRLLSLEVDPNRGNGSHPVAISESVRLTIALYLLMVHGPTYYSHAGLQYTLALQLNSYLEDCLTTILLSNGPLAIWLLSIGMVSSTGALQHQWFEASARKAAAVLSLRTWDDVLVCLKQVLWLEKQWVEHVFQQTWISVWAIMEA
jgi:hypothetical protein